MAMLHDAWLIARKDLKLEIRSRVALNQVVPFALLVLVLFAFALDPDRGLLEKATPGLYWIAVLFSGLLAMQRSFAVEAADGVSDALRLSGLARLPEVIRSLLRNPQIGPAAVLDTQPAFQPQRHFRRDCGPSVQHAGQGGARNAKLLGGIGNGQAQRGEYILPQGFAGVRRIVDSGHAPCS